MEYSFKKHIQRDYISNTLFALVIVFLALYIGGIFFPTLIMSIFDKSFNFELFKNLLIYLSFFPAISIILMIPVLIKANSLKKFLMNYSEISCRIESYKEMINPKHGNEYGIKAIFSYTIDCINYSKKYKIANTKYTKEFYDSYKVQGKSVKILVDNANPKNIIIREIFS